MTERLRYYARHPLDLFPTQAKMQALQRRRVRSARDTAEAEKAQQSGTSVRYTRAATPRRLRLSLSRIVC